MTPDAALDNFAFLVGLRMIGPDARLRLRIALAKDPAVKGHPGFDVDRAERLSLPAASMVEPETLQERLDVARIEREREAPPFDTTFWKARHADLVRAGFEPEQATKLVDDVRTRIETASPEPETLPC